MGLKRHWQLAGVEPVVWEWRAAPDAEPFSPVQTAFPHSELPHGNFLSFPTG